MHQVLYQLAARLYTQLPICIFVRVDTIFYKASTLSRSCFLLYWSWVQSELSQWSVTKTKKISLNWTQAAARNCVWKSLSCSNFWHNCGYHPSDLAWYRPMWSASCRDQKVSACRQLQVQAWGCIVWDYVKENPEEKYRARFREKVCMDDQTGCTLLGFSV